jgi:hypothetical protein
MKTTRVKASFIPGCEECGSKGPRHEIEFTNGNSLIMCDNCAIGILTQIAMAVESTDPANDPFAANAPDGTGDL